MDKLQELLAQIKVLDTKIAELKKTKEYIMSNRKGQ